MDQSHSFSFKEEFGDAFLRRKVLVTGATGFIGYSLCSALHELGAEISGIALGGTMAAELAGMPIHYFDLNDSQILADTLDQNPPAFVFHLASLVETGRDPRLVLPTLKNNLLSTVNLMTALQPHAIRRLVVISSSEAPTSNAEPPASPYAASKQAVTAYARMFAELYHFPVATARLFTCFGPRQPRNKLIPHIIDAYSQGQAPTFTQPGRALDYIYVKDFVRGLLLTALADQANGEVLDFGNGAPLAIAEMAGIVRELMGSTAEVQAEVTAQPAADSARADVEKSLRIAHWAPHWSLEQGLLETIDWYRKNLN
jgi:nucleoside-diphosphate-sugar epimerase